MRSYILYLEDIIKAMESIKDFVRELSFEEFEADDKTSSAVIQKFEIIGEAANQIPERIVKEYNDIPWNDMVGMRNKLIHHYFGIDHKLVWETIQNKLSAVEDRIKVVLEKEKG